MCNPNLVMSNLRCHVYLVTCTLSRVPHIERWSTYDRYLASRGLFFLRKKDLFTALFSPKKWNRVFANIRPFSVGAPLLFVGSLLVSSVVPWLRLGAPCFLSSGVGKT